MAISRRAHALYEEFWGVPPDGTTTLNKGQSGRKKTLVSLGKCPAISLSETPEGPHTRHRLCNATLAVDPNGRRLVVLFGSKVGSPKKFVGYVAVTEYIAPPNVAKAGSHKANTRWTHEHTERGGKRPRAYQDGFGNIHYQTGTCRVGEWIER